MKNKTIKLLGIGATILFILLMLAPLSTAQQSTRKLLEQRVVYGWSVITVTWIYDDGHGHTAIFDKNWHLISAWSW